jgi:hypothetical protein
MLYEGMKILEIKTTTRVIAALESGTIDHLATGIGGGRGDEMILTNSSSRSMAERALIIEPLSDSMEEDILPPAGLRRG